jgi:hypothetical protein
VGEERGEGIGGGRRREEIRVLGRKVEKKKLLIQWGRCTGERGEEGGERGRGRIERGRKRGEREVNREQEEGGVVIRQLKNT